MGEPLEGKVALVTGAARGIGAGIAKRLAMGGAAVALHGLARDLGPRGITVNNIQPGPVDTDGNPADGSFADTLRSLTAIHRFAHTDEIAALVACLESPGAALITGASIKIDGGFAS